MKFTAFAAVFIFVLSFRLAPTRAQDASDDPVALPPAVAQLFADLATIPAGSAVTDAQQQALVADLDALAAGIFTPDPDDIDQLATDLGTAASAGLITSDVEAELAADFSVDPDDPDSQDGWLDDIEDDVLYLLRPIDSTDPTTTIDPTFVTYNSAKGGAFVSGSYQRSVLPLTAQGIPPYLLENYAGSIRLVTRQVLGGPIVSKLTVQTTGLPLSNPYQVSITRRSDGTPLVIGKLRVRNLYYLNHTSSATPAAELLSSGRATFGGSNAHKTLPAGFDPNDVASVTLTDSQGVVRLSGSVAGAPPTRQVRVVTLRLAPAAGAPAAAFANAFVRHVADSAGTIDQFHLSARHLPAGDTVTLWINGTSAGNFPTSHKGRLVIATGLTPASSSTVYPLPTGVDLSDVKSLTLVDALGNVLIKGSLGN